MSDEEDLLFERAKRMYGKYAAVTPVSITHGPIFRESLTKLEVFTMAAMQGFLANSSDIVTSWCEGGHLAEMSIDAAKSVLAALERQNEKPQEIFPGTNEALAKLGVRKE